MNEKITAKTIRRDARYFRTDIDMAITLTPAFLKDICEAQNRFLYKVAERMEELEEPVRHGHWTEHPRADEEHGQLVSNYECSICKNWSREDYNYCPDCGAKMEVEE